MSAIAIGVQVAAPLLALAFTAACGSSGAAPAADASVIPVDGSTTDGATADGTGPLSCQASLQSLLGCFQVSPQCAQALETWCASAAFGQEQAASLNPAAYAAIAPCVPSHLDCSCFQSSTGTCAQGEAAQACELARLATLTPTATEAMVKRDFCATCTDPQGQAACAGFFGVGDGGAGVGLLVLLMSDALAAQVDTLCTGLGLDASAAGGCTPAFTQCAAGVYTQASRALSPSAMLAAACDGGFQLLPADGGAAD